MQETNVNLGFKYLAKGVATIPLAYACCEWMQYTSGSSGIGWFIFGLLILWGSN